MLYNSIYYLLNSKDTLSSLEVMPRDTCIKTVRWVVEVEVNSQAGLLLVNCVNKMLSFKRGKKTTTLICCFLQFEILHDQVPRSFSDSPSITLIYSLLNCSLSQTHTYFSLLRSLCLPFPQCGRLGSPGSYLKSYMNIEIRSEWSKT